MTTDTHTYLKFNILGGHSIVLIFITKITYNYYKRKIPLVQQFTPSHLNGTNTLFIVLICSQLYLYHVYFQQWT